MQSTLAIDNTSGCEKCRDCARWIYSGEVYSHELMRHVPAGICTHKRPLQSIVADSKSCGEGFKPRNSSVVNE